MGFPQQLAAQFHRDLRRLAQELNAFPDDASLWQTRPGVSNSAGHLTLHLAGNLREFIGRILGGIAYQRNRPAEFNGPPQTQAELQETVQQLIELIPPIIAELTPAQLDELYVEQTVAPEITTRQFLMHLYGHFSYHLGQIDYLRRVVTGQGSVDFARL